MFWLTPGAEPLEPRRLLCDWGWSEALAHEETGAAAEQALTPVDVNAYAHGGALHVDAASFITAADPARTAANAEAAPAGVAPGKTTLRIETGAVAPYTDGAGRTWSPDTGYAGGSVSRGSFPVAGTSDDRLYFTRRWGTFTYANAVANGSYTLRLYFMDPFYSTAGMRKFNVYAEGIQILNSFDIAAGGGYRAALVKSFPVTVADGTLNLSFQSIVENALLGAIELLPSGVVAPPPAIVSAPAAPQGLGATAGPSTVALRWQDVSNESGYRVERKDGSGVYRQIAALGANATSYTDAGPFAPATTQLYRVRAYNSAGASNYSNEASAYVAFGTLTWRNGAASPVTRAEAARAVVNNRMYVFGGYYNAKIQATPRCDVYDPATDTWRRIADQPVAITHQGMVVDGTTVWLIGGYVGDHPGPGTTQVWKYDTVRNTWTRGPDLPDARGAGAAAIVGRTIHFFGGMERTRRVDMGTHWALDLGNPASGWTRLADMPNPRNHLTGVAYGGKVYAIGGHYQQEAAAVTQSEVDCFDPATGRWTRVADTPTPRSQTPGASFVYGNRIVVVGGADRAEHSTTVVSAYDPSRNRWDTIGFLPAARRATSAGIINGRLIVTTGNDPYPSATTWISNVLGVLA